MTYEQEISLLATRFNSQIATHINADTTGVYVSKPLSWILWPARGINSRLNFEFSKDIRIEPVRGFVFSSWDILCVRMNTSKAGFNRQVIDLDFDLGAESEVEKLVIDTAMRLLERDSREYAKWVIDFKNCTLVESRSAFLETKVSIPMLISMAIAEITEEPYDPKMKAIYEYEQLRILVNDASHNRNQSRALRTDIPYAFLRIKLLKRLDEFIQISKIPLNPHDVCRGNYVSNSPY